MYSIRMRAATHSFCTFIPRIVMVVLEDRNNELDQMNDNQRLRVTVVGLDDFKISKYDKIIPLPTTCVMATGFHSIAIYLAAA